MRACVWLTLMGLASIAPAAESDATLMAQEQRDAHMREKGELNSRIADLQQQADTIESLTDRQAQYIQQLQAQIDALQQQDPVEHRE